MNTSPAPGNRIYVTVVGVIFLALLAAAGLRAAPAVLMQPMEQAFGWSREITSLSAAVGIFLYGLVGPFSAALMESVGIRRTLMGALALMGMAILASTQMTQPWHLILTWGVLSGLGSGCVATVLAATVVTRWFATRRGVVMGLLTASTATGSLIFLPAMAALASHGGWQPVAMAIAVAMGLLIPLVYFFVPERPSTVGCTRYGAAPDEQIPPRAGTGVLSMAFGALGRAARTRTFWALAATFFVCGFTTNGLVGTHLIAFCGDHGIPEIRAASLLAIMGLFDLIGTTASGWLTDRYDPRKLLFIYYGIRGLSLVYLPHSGFTDHELMIFAVFYGLDWIATVPPTLRLANEAFGDRDAPIAFGWIVAGHQLGAACAAYLAGWLRSVQGNYTLAFELAGAIGVAAALVALSIARKARSTGPRPT